MADVPGANGDTTPPFPAYRGAPGRQARSGHLSRSLPPSPSCERCATSAPGVLRAPSWTIAVSIGGTAARACCYASVCLPCWVYPGTLSVPATCPIPAMVCRPHGCSVCLLILRRRMRPGPASFLIRTKVPVLPPSPIRCSWQCQDTLLPPVTRPSPVIIVSGQVLISLHH